MSHRTKKNDVCLAKLKKYNNILDKYLSLAPKRWLTELFNWNIFVHNEWRFFLISNRIYCNCSSKWAGSNRRLSGWNSSVILLRFAPTVSERPKPISSYYRFFPQRAYNAAGVAGVHLWRWSLATTRPSCSYASIFHKKIKKLRIFFWIKSEYTALAVANGHGFLVDNKTIKKSITKSKT